jgi:hypothetical protein
MFKPKLLPFKQLPNNKVVSSRPISSISQNLQDNNINIRNYLLDDDSYESNNNYDSDTNYSSELDISNNEDKLSIENEIITDINHINETTRFINKIVKTKRCKNKRIRKTTKDINYEVVKYKNNKYVVCCIPFNDTHKMFIFDYDKKIDVIQKSWHYMAEGNYISNTYNTDEIKSKQLYLHNFVMDKLTFEGKGTQHTIDHINRIGTDNRKVNLRNLESQTAQNFNQKKRERITELPDDCNIDANDIPKNIYYGKPNGLHGDFFYIELKGIPILCPDDKKYTWKSTRSKSVDLKIKFQQTLDKLLELKNSYPQLNDVIIDDNNDQRRKDLIDEYNDILKLSHYPQNIINNNLATFEYEAVEFNIIQDNNTNELNKIKHIKDLGKKLIIYLLIVVLLLI